MGNTFILSCESTVDLPYSYVSGRNIPVLFYAYSIDGTEYPDDMGRDPEALGRFYKFIEDGKLPSTSQINTFRYEEYFDELLQRGDVLHITLGSGMTSSPRNAELAAEKMREKYPDRKLVVIDSLCSSSGYGMLVDSAADLRDEGKSLEEVEAWTLENRHFIHHQFYSTDLTHFRRGGRVSGAAAMVATVLGICPIMHLNKTGHIIAYSKARGKKNAISATVKAMEEHASGGLEYSGKCFVYHSNCIADAEETISVIKSRFLKLTDIRLFDIGTIIGSHTGVGTVSVSFFGGERDD